MLYLFVAFQAWIAPMLGVAANIVLWSSLAVQNVVAHVGSEVLVRIALFLLCLAVGAGLAVYFLMRVLRTAAPAPEAAPNRVSGHAPPWRSSSPPT